MDITLIIIGALLLLVGIAGSVLPVIPGPPIAYVALILLQLTDKAPFSITFLVIAGVLTVGITILDYVVPTIGVKKFGGSKGGSWGSIVGIILGLFIIPPYGVFIMPFFGALIGELIVGKKSKAALRAAFGSFIGFLSGVLMKLLFCIGMCIAFIWGLF